MKALFLKYMGWRIYKTRSRNKDEYVALPSMYRGTGAQYIYAPTQAAIKHKIASHKIRYGW